MAEITIDPVTRIEGHLKVDVTVRDVEPFDVMEAKVSGTMARGIEALLVGKDPRDAPYVTERICGVCFSAHGWTSCLAVEQAHGTTALPEAARLLRNLIVGACWLHDHPLHFYHLAALDYLDLAALLYYDGDDTAILKIKELVANDSGNGDQAGPLLPRYSPDGFCVNDPEDVAFYVGHYLQALAMQIKAKKMSALLAGKQPHQSGLIVGGVSQLPSISHLDLYELMFDEQKTFIEDVYVADVTALGTGPLLPLAKLPVGVGHLNFLSYGGFPDPMQGYEGDFMYPAGALVGGIGSSNLEATTREEIEPLLTEDVTNAWYRSDTGGRPSETQQIFDLGKTGAYSFVKGPRFDGHPMEVGPLARMLVALNRPNTFAGSHDATGTLAYLVGLGVTPGAVARHAARALETTILLDRIPVWLDELRTMINNATPGNPVIIHDTDHWDPPESSEVCCGMTEAPRGGLAHWVGIDNHVISHYACVVPTTWNSSPTDAGGKGPYEEALMGCPVDVNNPINVVRVIRSFDPCIACAVHVTTPKGDTKKYVLDV